MIDEKALLDLAKQFLQTPKGKELVAKAEAAKAEASGALPPGVTIDDVKNEIKNFDAVKYLAILKRYVPVIQTFTTSGRVYDEQTNEPLEGVKVTPQFALYPMLPKTVEVKERIVNAEGKRETIRVKKQVFRYNKDEPNSCPN
jgi:hypothetical protein